MNKNMNKKGAIMKKGRNWGWIFGMVSVLMLLKTPSINGEESKDFLSKFHPYITVTEEYSDNINLTATNKKSDFITTVNAGLTFSALSEKTYGIDLNVAAGYVYYARDHKRDYSNPSGTLNAWYKVAPTLTFRVTDDFIRSDAAREQDYSPNALQGQYLLSTERGKAIYIRNVFSPSLEYQFGKENSFSLNYRNNFYENQSRRYEDSKENYINPRLTYWFDIRNGISLEYGLTFGDFERSPDFVGHTATGRYTYRFNPRTSIFGEYTQNWYNFENPSENPSNDYVVYRPSVGISHAFTSTLSGSAQAGYYWKNANGGADSSGPYYNLSLTQRAQKTTYTVSFQGGYTEDYFTAENLGFSKYYRVLGSINHQLMPKVTTGLFSSFEWAKSDGERDRIWNIGANVSYQVLKWLSASLRFSHRANHSNNDLNDYSEYRGIFSLTASF
jgi:hypothetical protein